MLVYKCAVTMAIPSAAIWLCHHSMLFWRAGPLAVAANQNEDVEEPWSTYLHLWQAILQDQGPSKQASAKSSRGSGSSSSSTKAAGVRLGLHAAAASPEAVAAKQQSVYDALMRAIMDAVKNLDLEYHQADGAVASDMQDKLTSPDRKNPTVQVGNQLVRSDCKKDASCGPSLPAFILIEQAYLAEGFAEGFADGERDTYSFALTSSASRAPCCLMLSWM